MGPDKVMDDFVNKLKGLSKTTYTPTFEYSTNDYNVKVVNVGQNKDLETAFKLVNGEDVQLDKSFNLTKVLKPVGITEDMIKNGEVTYDSKSGHLIIRQDRSFLDKYGDTINTTLAGVSTGINLFNTVQNYETNKLQRQALKEQINAFKQQTQQAQEEYQRIKNLRAKLNASYA